VSAPLAFQFAGPEIPLILVPALVNGRGPYHLLIDTGNGEAEPILFRPLAAALDLVARSEREAPGVLGVVRTARVRLDRLEVGEVNLSGVEVLLLDELQLPPVDVPPAGILGYGFFRHYRLVIDYPGRTLEFAATRDTSASGGAPFTLGSPKPYVIIDARVNRGPIRSFLLDTGASSTTLSPALATELGLTVRPIQAVGIGGATDAGIAVVSRLEAADLEERDAEVAVIDLFGSVSRAAGRRIDGVLGYPFLKHCRLEIDYPARGLLIEPRREAVRR
jgi:predicted aspartyl protease